MPADASTLVVQGRLPTPPLASRSSARLRALGRWRLPRALTPLLSPLSLKDVLPALCEIRLFPRDHATFCNNTHPSPSSLPLLPSPLRTLNAHISRRCDRESHAPLAARRAFCGQPHRSAAASVPCSLQLTTFLLLQLSLLPLLLLQQRQRWPKGRTGFCLVRRSLQLKRTRPCSGFSPQLPAAPTHLLRRPGTARSAVPSPPPQPRACASPERPAVDAGMCCCRCSAPCCAGAVGFVQVGCENEPRGRGAIGA
eukprot:363696-Chlamydomonas_euryale.AAC.9